MDNEHDDLRYKYLKIMGWRDSFEDKFDLPAVNGRKPKTAARINQILGWDMNLKDLKAMVQEITYFYKQLKLLNEPSRRFFTTLVELAEPLSGSNDHKMAVIYQEVANTLNLSNREVNTQMNILEQLKFKLGYIEDGGYPIQIVVQASDWPLLADIKNYARLEGIELKKILVELQFYLLD